MCVLSAFTLYHEQTDVDDDQGDDDSHETSTLDDEDDVCDIDDEEDALRDTPRRSPRPTVRRGCVIGFSACA